MSLWECCELLNNVVDDSDPDLDEPQMEHLLQTAEAIKKDFPNEYWLQLTALLHGGEGKWNQPSTALFIISYHSFYPMHKSGTYKHLMNEEDVENLKWLKIFNKYDLYNKSKVRIYVEKYFPAKLRW